LIEEFIEGREMTVLVAENPEDPTDPLSFTPGEAVFLVNVLRKIGVEYMRHFHMSELFCKYFIRKARHSSTFT